MSALGPMVPGGIARLGSSRAVLVTGLLLLCFDILRRYFRNDAPSTPTGSPSKRKGSRPCFAVTKKISSVRAKNLEFMRKFLYLFNMAVPDSSGGWKTLVLLAALLLMRTVISVSHVKLGAETATHFVSRRWAALYRSIALFALLSLPGSIVNAALKHFQGKLSEGMAGVLTSQINDAYLQSKTFRQLAQRHHFLPRKKDVHKIEETISHAVQNYTDKVGSVYCCLLKPLIDCCMYTVSLGRVVGWQGPAFIWLFFLLRRKVRSGLKVREGGHALSLAEYDEASKRVHRHIIKNSTELAINCMVERENQVLTALVAQREGVQEDRSQWLSTIISAFDNILLRYGASVAGYFVLLSPYLINLDRVRYKTSSIMTRDYIICLKSLTELNRAIFEIEDSLSLLSGIEASTGRLAEFMMSLEGMRSEAKEADRRTVRRHANVTRANVGGAQQNGTASRSPSPPVQGEYSEWVQTGAVQHAPEHPPPDQAERWAREWTGKRLSFHPTGSAPTLAIEGMDVVAPPLFNVEMSAPAFSAGATSGAKPEDSRGTLLVRNLTLTVKPGTSLLISGRKGSGKTSIFRVLGGVWRGEPTGPDSYFSVNAINHDEMHHPRNILYVAEEPHLLHGGSLRDQIIYPYTQEEAAAVNVTDGDIAKLLCLVDHAQTILGTWSLNDKKDWGACLSPTQRQCLGIARLFFHKPHYAFFDEATTCLSEEVEDFVYMMCRQMSITTLTATRSPSEHMMEHHDLHLSLFATSYTLEQRTRT